MWRVCVFYVQSFWTQGRFWELVCQAERGKRLSAFVHTCTMDSFVFIECVLCVSSIPWCQRGLTPPAALFSRRLSCEVALVRWLMALALLLPIGEQWQTAHTALYFNLDCSLCPPLIFYQAKTFLRRHNAVRIRLPDPEKTRLFINLYNLYQLPLTVTCLWTFVSCSRLFSRKEIFCFWVIYPPLSSGSIPACCREKQKRPFRKLGNASY